jgi:hypothetical protein
MSNQIKPHDVVVGTRRLDFKALAGRGSDSKEVKKGLREIEK